MQQPEYYGNQRREMIPFVPSTAATVLDLGCGAGVFSARLKATRQAEGKAVEVWGVEMSAEAAARAGKVLDRVLTGEISEQLPNLPAGYFDCIVLNDILEHLVHPENILKVLGALLKPGGHLVASIPNVRYFFNVLDLVWHGRWEYTDEGILDRTHLRFFTRSSIIRMLQDCGFSVVKIQGINPTGSIKFKLANLGSFGRYSDMRYLQFAVVARPADGR